MGVGDPVGHGRGDRPRRRPVRLRAARPGSPATARSSPSAGRLNLRNAAATPPTTARSTRRLPVPGLRPLVAGVPAPPARRCGEPTAPRLLTLHNVAWTLRLVDRMRAAIRAGDASTTYGAGDARRSGADEPDVRLTRCPVPDQAGVRVDILSILIFVLPLCAALFILVCRSSGACRHTRRCVARLELGDEVMTTAGLYGTGRRARATTSCTSRSRRGRRAQVRPWRRGPQDRRRRGRADERRGDATTTASTTAEIDAAADGRRQRARSTTTWPRPSSGPPADASPGCRLAHRHRRPRPWPRSSARSSPATGPSSASTSRAAPRSCSRPPRTTTSTTGSTRPSRSSATASTPSASPSPRSPARATPSSSSCPASRTSDRALEVVGQTAELRFRPVLAVAPTASARHRRRTTTAPGDDDHDRSPARRPTTTATAGDDDHRRAGPAETTHRPRPSAPRHDASRRRRTTAVGRSSDDVRRRPCAARRRHRPTTDDPTPAGHPAAAADDDGDGDPRRRATSSARCPWTATTSSLVGSRSSTTPEAADPGRRVGACSLDIQRRRPRAVQRDRRRSASTATPTCPTRPARHRPRRPGRSRRPAIQPTRRVPAVQPRRRDHHRRRGNRSPSRRPRTWPSCCATAPCRSSSSAQTVQTVSATLGKDSLRAGLLAGAHRRRPRRPLHAPLLPGPRPRRAARPGRVVGPRLSSIIAWLGENQGLALSLAGVTGIIVSVGVTVDSYVVYFERLKDEVRSGKTIRSSVDRGLPAGLPHDPHRRRLRFIGAALLYVLTVGAGPRLRLLPRPVDDARRHRRLLLHPAAGGAARPQPVLHRAVRRASASPVGARRRAAAGAPRGAGGAAPT